MNITVRVKNWNSLYIQGFDFIKMIMNCMRVFCSECLIMDIDITYSTLIYHINVLLLYQI